MPILFVSFVFTHAAWGNTIDFLESTSEGVGIVVAYRDIQFVQTDICFFDHTGCFAHTDILQIRGEVHAGLFLEHMREITF